MLKNNLGEDKVFPLVLKLAIPSMLAQFVNVLYTIVDRFFVTQIPNVGDLALAAVGVATPVTTFIIAFAFLVGLGGAPLMAIKMGEGNNKQAEKILFNCVFSLVMVSIILMIVAYSFKDYYLWWFGASENTFPMANEYLSYFLIGTIFAVGGLGLNSFITAQGYSGIAMSFVITAALTNILLDYVFIMVCNMGVKGAAIATVIAQAVGFFLMIGFLLSKKSKIRLRPQKIDFNIVKRVMVMGFGPFLINSTDSLVLIVLNSIMQKTGGAQLGDIYLSATTIVLSFMQLIATPLNGITLGSQPVVSFNYGAQKIKRVKQALASVMFVSFVFCLTMTFATQFGAELFVSLFTDDPQVFDLAVKWVKIYNSAVLCLSIQYSTLDMMVAMGLPVRSSILSLNRKVATVILIVTLPIALGGVGAMIAEPIGEAWSMLCSGIVFFASVGKVLKKRENEVVVHEE